MAQDAALKETPNALPDDELIPSWVSELTRLQRIGIKACLPFFFKAQGVGGWRWHSDGSNMTVLVTFGAEKNTLVISVVDDEAHEPVELWTTSLRLTGVWRQRVRQASGEAQILAQSRPRCSKCSSPVILRKRHDDSVQFFGCTSYPKCHGSLNIIDHDIERA